MNGAELRAAREAAGYSRNQLAEVVGVSPSAIGCLERDGRPRGGPNVFDKVAEALRGISPQSNPNEPLRGGEPIEIKRGDVVSATVAGYEVLLHVTAVVDPTIDGATVSGTEMHNYTTDVMKKCGRSGARMIKHNGKAYALGNGRVIPRTLITKHWPVDRSATVADVEEGDHDQ
jgi:transcriptional regulator with XRE-family HTH domain